jgi:hemoglobin
MTSLNANAEETLFQRLGGIEAVRAAVNEFYDRLLADERLALFFEETSMTQLRMHQLKFFELAFTRIPDDLDVAQYITEKHARLFKDKGLNETHFDMVAEHFMDTLTHLNVHPHLVEEAIRVIGPLRPVFAAGVKNTTDVATAAPIQNDDAETPSVAPIASG